MNKMIKIGISQGDINGIAYELILKTFEDARMFELCIPILYGSSKVLAYHRKAMELTPININTILSVNDAGANRLNIINCGNEEISVEFSRPTPEGEKAAEKALLRALDDLKKGNIDILLTTPSNVDEKSILQEKLGNGKNRLTILVNDSFRIGLATDEIPFSEAIPLLNADFLVERIKTLHSSLIKDFMITTPRIAVLSLNPGVGLKEQKFGKEETEFIIPAIKSASDSGIICFGPYAADDFFGSDEYKKFDATLAMYSDQGQIPFRTISNEEGILYTSNLPYVIAAPDQNVSYDKAGKNVVKPDSLRNAVYTALDIFRNRITDEKINANPLKKQYFERGSDNEKLDLTGDEE